MVDQVTQGPTQEQVEAWLARRFPDPRPFGQREREASQRTRHRRRRVAVALVVVLVAVIVGYVVLAVNDGADASLTPADRYPWVRVVATILEIAGPAASVVAVVLLVRLDDRDRREPALRALKALEPAQRRELDAEIRGRRPVVPGDEPVLVRIASSSVAQCRAFAWLGVALAAGIAWPWLDAPTSPHSLATRTVTTVSGLAAVTLTAIRWRRARAFLRRVGPAATTDPAPAR